MESGMKHLILIITAIAVIAIVAVVVSMVMSNSEKDIKTDSAGLMGIIVPGTQTEIYAPNDWIQNATYDSESVKLFSPDNSTEVLAMYAAWNVPYGVDLTKQIVSQGYIDDGVYNMVIDELNSGDGDITNITPDENNYKINGMPARELKGINNKSEQTDVYMLVNKDDQFMFVAMKSTPGNDTYTGEGEAILKSIK